MSRWFRHYAGMMRDDKLVRVALRSKQPIERVCWVWGAILESAAEIDDGGRFDFDPDEAAWFLRTDASDLADIVTALAQAGRVAEDHVVKWGNRQFASDRSKDRVAAYRERKRSESGAGNDRATARDDTVTLQELPRNAPETETELETENPPKPPRKRRGEGKTLIPEDWVLPPVESLTPKARACVEQWTRESYETVGEGFALYWRRERKMTADWHATFCGWVIREHSKVMRDQKFGSAPPAANGTARKAKEPETVEELERAVRCAEDNGWAGPNVDAWRHKLDRLRNCGKATGPPIPIGELINLHHPGPP